ncbi:MAG: ASKHA domain-containing protein [Lachnospiraceae bacterium]|nr:ASKHA domain-containing protein [Lachnospiraceae bacterium]
MCSKTAGCLISFASADADKCDILSDMKKGNRCTICTGCGRCFGEFEDPFDILTIGEGRFTGGLVSRPLICTDIGTTTVAMAYVGADGKVAGTYVSLNPQGRFGADVLSRIKASADKYALEEMKESIRNVIGTGVKKFIRENDLNGKLDMYVSANTTMIYLLMGYDPAELGEAPFTASHINGDSYEMKISDVTVSVRVLPGFSAFVGSDIYSGILAADICSSDKYRLLCDLGTNGEIALGNKDHLYVTATAAGPAFEGGPCKGIWGADMIHLTSVLLKGGYADRSGLLKDPWFDEGIDIGNVHITQESIRALQLAKAAMNAGIRIICEKAGITFGEIEKCTLSGGFGVHLNPWDAAYIGLLPGELINICTAGGNTSLAGAYSYAAGARVVQDPEVVNLALEPDFNGLYTSAIDFPG